MQEFNLASYHPIFLYLFIVVGFAVTTLVAAHVIGPKPKKTPVKQMPYESGMDPIGDAHMRFDVRFYLIAISFLVFDVELLILYPWAVIAYREPPMLMVQGHTVFWVVLVFLALLVVAYLYDLRKGVFRWR
jgi:NADH-quinone oxidoreductase subunit A